MPPDKDTLMKIILPNAKENKPQSFRSKLFRFIMLVIFMGGPVALVTWVALVAVPFSTIKLNNQKMVSWLNVINSAQVTYYENHGSFALYFSALEPYGLKDFPNEIQASTKFYVNPDNQAGLPRQCFRVQAAYEVRPWSYYIYDSCKNGAEGPFYIRQGLLWKGLYLLKDISRSEFFIPVIFMNFICLLIIFSQFRALRREEEDNNK